MLPAVMSFVRENSEYRLFSQINTIGKSQIEDIFNDSAKIPLFIAPSPKNATLIELLLFNLAAKAAPVYIPIPPPTIAFAPIMPFSKSEMCIEPP